MAGGFCSGADDLDTVPAGCGDAPDEGGGMAGGPAGADGWGEITPRGTPGAYEEGAVRVMAGGPAGVDGWGEITPGGTPGAYEIGCPPVGSGAPGGAAGVAADCPGLVAPAGGDGAATHETGVTAGVDSAPRTDRENDLAGATASANVVLCCLSTS